MRSGKNKTHGCHHKSVLLFVLHKSTATFADKYCVGILTDLKLILLETNVKVEKGYFTLFTL